MAETLNAAAEAAWIAALLLGTPNPELLWPFRVGGPDAATPTVWLTAAEAAALRQTCYYAISTVSNQELRRFMHRHTWYFDDLFMNHRASH